jgi:hypothetical protein
MLPEYIQEIDKNRHNSLTKWEIKFPYSFKLNQSKKTLTTNEKLKSLDSNKAQTVRKIPETQVKINLLIDFNLEINMN